MLLRVLAWLLHRPRLRLRPFTAAAHRLAARTPVEEPQLRVGRLRSGSRIVLDLRDHAQRHVYLYGESEPDTTAVFRSLVRPGSVVVDVGANAGYYSLLAADLGATVHAFEPQPEVCSRLRRSVELNGAAVTVVEAACGAADGELLLYASGDPFFGGMATLREGYYTLSREGAPVRVVALDSYCAGFAPDLVKIDVEGFEAEVLKGMRRLLAEARPPIVCEWATDREQSAEFRALVEESGYELVPIDEGEGAVNALLRPRV